MWHARNTVSPLVCREKAEVAQPQAFSSQPSLSSVCVELPKVAVNDVQRLLEEARYAYVVVLLCVCRPPRARGWSVAVIVVTEAHDAEAGKLKIATPSVGRVVVDNQGVDPVRVLLASQRIADVREGICC